jgi:hypothetical protein
MLRRLRAWLRRITEARQDRIDASFKGQLARAKRKQSDLQRLDEEVKFEMKQKERPVPTRSEPRQPGR